MFSNDDFYRAILLKINGAGVAVMFSPKEIKMLGNTFKKIGVPPHLVVLLKEIR